jgi:alkylated DNA repair dioxygenase AlkB
MKHEQLALFAAPSNPVSPPAMPAGFRYAPDVIDAAEETRLVAAFADLPFKEFEFHGFLGKRRVVSFGQRYDFNSGALKDAEPMPDFLLPLRERAAALAGLTQDDLQHALVTEYQPGVSIGWHRDRPHYDDVIGVSLLSPCTFRLRRKHGASWQRASLRLPPRSIYLMRGPSRDQGSTPSPPWRRCATPSPSARCVPVLRADFCFTLEKCIMQTLNL